MNKSSNLRVRVEPELHREFLQACKVAEKPAAEILREFMKQYIAEQGNSQQQDMFMANNQ